MFLVLNIISGMIAIPVPAIGVPFVLQNMLIMMTGGFLGKKYGTFLWIKYGVMTLFI
ncbi:hypothetical protein RU86_GL000013 [Lactococcus piscium]|uniref:Uncharacterized protein n=1 Tax=Pseudolactococcus piscium TaxID=1364 RepID=A0A2A5S5J0_9LACT|nr:hypothetical protein [Lactococcus piscium]PCS08777.1 hypothetical protein RU86_GL000013 [Lactococcus piscium]